MLISGFLENNWIKSFAITRKMLVPLTGQNTFLVVDRTKIITPETLMLIFIFFSQEGHQASLAADFSVLQFEFISRLFLVHGRYSYKRSAALSQFVMHRGLIISTIQAIFSSIFYFSSVALYQGFLMVG